MVARLGQDHRYGAVVGRRVVTDLLRLTAVGHLPTLNGSSYPKRSLAS